MAKVAHENEGKKKKSDLLKSWMFFSGGREVFIGLCKSFVESKRKCLLVFGFIQH
jgi:hypothetical protein